MSLQCGEAMARRRKEDGRVGSASHGMVRRWGRFFSRGSPRGVLDRERVPERCYPSGAVVDVCSAAPARAQRAERAANGGVVYVSRALSIRHVHREFLRSVRLGLTPITAVTACHQRHDVERYSRFILPLPSEGHKFLLHQVFSSGKTMCGMPFHSTLLWYRTITPTTAGQNDHHNKKQHQSYPGSFHRTALL
jgi:hypothetical protein